jgi:hypothetical protein
VFLFCDPNSQKFCKNFARRFKNSKIFARTPIIGGSSQGTDSEGLRTDRQVLVSACDVRYWRKTGIPTRPINVRFGGEADIDWTCSDVRLMTQSRHERLSIATLLAGDEFAVVTGYSVSAMLHSLPVTWPSPPLELRCKRFQFGQSAMQLHILRAFAAAVLLIVVITSIANAQQ